MYSLPVGELHYSRAGIEKMYWSCNDRQVYSRSRRIFLAFIQNARISGMKPITKRFLGIEERARSYFERMPFVQAFLAGIGVIIFWRGIWEWFDRIDISPFGSVVIGSLILGGVGVFVQTFIGNTIIIREVKQEERIEKKAIQKVEGETLTEGVTLAELSQKIDRLIEQVGKR